MEINKKIGKSLKEKRNQNGYSLEDIQTLLKRDLNIELDISNISRYENGTVKNLNPVYLKGICKVNGIDYLSIFKELGYVDEEVGQKITKREKLQKEEFMNQATMMFNDESISEEDKEKLLARLQEAFYTAKLMNKKK